MESRTVLLAGNSPYPSSRSRKLYFGAHGAGETRYRNIQQHGQYLHQHRNANSLVSLSTILSILFGYFLWLSPKPHPGGSRFAHETEIWLQSLCLQHQETDPLMCDIQLHLHCTPSCAEEGGQMELNRYSSRCKCTVPPLLSALEVDSQ